MMMNSRKVLRLSRLLLTADELKLAKHIAMILGKPKYDAASLIGAILPVYWIRRGNSTYTIPPRDVYRPFYYLQTYANKAHFGEITRPYVIRTGEHLEGCLKLLVKNTPELSRKLLGLPLGALVKELKAKGLLPEILADQLSGFNCNFNVPAKHPSAHEAIDESRDNLHKRTFSILDAALALVIMRKLSMQLFSLLMNRGITLPEGWRDFDKGWLCYNRQNVQQAD